MCGIAGIVSSGSVEVGCLQALAAALEHRGPDGYGYLAWSPGAAPETWLNQELPASTHARVGLAHRRLSILDLSTDSLQPMRSGEDLALVYNGELYNYRELKSELEGLGHPFRTSGDTEVLLAAYREWGVDCLRRLNGMWAFALLDARRRQLVLARDRFGIKPLYYAERPDALLFASEIKGLLAAPGPSPAPDEQTVARFLRTGMVDQGERTFFEGIRSFPAAHVAVVGLDGGPPRVAPRPFWSLSDERYAGTREQAVTQYRELFLDALALHSRSDVPVGTCLSGGLDSSSVVCASEQLRRRGRIPAYSHQAFGYCSGDPEFDERSYMEIVSRATGVHLHTIQVSEAELARRLPEIIALQDEPFASASVAAQWFVFQRAKQEGMTVMLDGQGADETLAGYHWYMAPLARSLLRDRRVADYAALEWAYRQERRHELIPPRKALRQLLPAGLVRGYDTARTYGQHVQNLLRPPAWDPPPRPTASFVDHDWVAGLPPDAQPSREGATLDAVLRQDVTTSVLPALLRYEDRCSMAHSIEARVPFLDYRLVELLFSLPDEWKIQRTRTKAILRDAMAGILPPAIQMRRDKIGFKSRPSLTFDMACDRADELLEVRSDMEARWFDADGLARLLRSGDRSQDHEFLLWRVINTKLWARHHWPS